MNGLVPAVKLKENKTKEEHNNIIAVHSNTETKKINITQMQHPYR